MSIALLSESSQDAVKSCVDKHMRKKAWMMTDFADLYRSDKAITHAHLLAVGLKGVTNAGEAFGGYILSVCPEIDVKTLDASFLGYNYHRIKVSADLKGMEDELKRVADIVATEKARDNAKAALDGTQTVEVMTDLRQRLDKARKVPMVESPKATEEFLKAQEIFEAIKAQYLGVSELVSA